MRLVALDEGNFGAHEHGILDIERRSFPTPWRSAMFREELKRAVSHLWILERDGACLGYVCFWTLPGELHLLNLAVHPDERRQGLGRLLVGSMLRSGVSQGAETAWLEVRPSNSAARGLYGRLGFTEKGRRPRYYRDSGEDAIVMSLEVRSAAAGQGEDLRLPEGARLVDMQTRAAAARQAGG